MPRGPPVFLKVAPDLEKDEHDRIVRVAIEHRIDAHDRRQHDHVEAGVKSRHAGETGGLSGAPLKPLAFYALRAFRSLRAGQIPLIAVGGIDNADDAWDRIRAGASLVQLYTAMVYEGPGHRAADRQGTGARLQREDSRSISEVVGAPPSAAGSAPRLRGGGRRRRRPGRRGSGRRSGPNPLPGRA